MAIVYFTQATNLGLQALSGKTAPSTSFVLRLFSNNLTPLVTHTEANFTEVTGGGYAAITLAAGSWTSTPGNPSSIAFPIQSFVFTGAIGGSTVAYGYYVTDGAGKALWAERFSSPPTPSNGMNIRVTLQVTLADAALGVPTYASIVADDGAGGYWRLGEASGDFASTIGSHTAVVSGSGTITYSQTGAISGDSNKGIKLSGSTLVGTVSSTVAALAASGVGSFEFWVKMGSLFNFVGETYHYAFFADNTTALTMVGLKESGSADNTFFVSAIRGGTEKLSTTPLSPGVLYHIIVSYGAGGAVTFYVNGSADGTFGSGSGTAALTIGTIINSSAAMQAANPAPGFYWGGIGDTTLLDELSAYPGVTLSAVQVARHYNIGAGLWGSGAFVTFNQATDIDLKAMMAKTAATTWTLRLFSNNQTPAVGNTEANYTEVSGGGYAAIALSAASWVATPGNPSFIEYPVQVFTFSGAPSPGTVYGCYITDNAGKALCAGKFPSVQNPGASDAIHINARLQMSQ